MERSRRVVNASAERSSSVITGLGGAQGWPALNWAWQLRDWIDRLIGGVGMRRGKAGALRVGETLDFWRIDALEAGRLLRLCAEMKLPEKPGCSSKWNRNPVGTANFMQQLFEPKGLGGVLYWYCLYPVHRLIFSRMIQRIAERAERIAINDT